MVELLDSSSQSLLGVINDILDISKIEAGKFKIIRSKTDVVQLSQAVIDLLKFKATEKNIELRLEVAPGFPRQIIADSLRLNQILMNLISNSVKFTEKGCVTLGLKVLNTKGNSAHLEFSIKDTGIGITKEQINRLFESFEQAEDTTAQRFGGTGLGLSIVKKLAELKGGSLSVKSIEKKGSEFIFTNWYEVVPEGELKPEHKISANDLPKFVDLTILVAEDNMINQFMIKKILSSWNIKVEAVDDGNKVLEKLKENHYDLILMDTHMPVMNGYEATRKIRSEMKDGKQNIPIISLSAAILENEQQAAKDAGVDDILGKPFDPVVLYKMIERLVKKG
jgi:CheY-like chemotaxis protein